ncbi:uncharacterized protein CELE_F29C4.4 [Caenorhabditis elegans]|uniref:Uncharacterized protein n=1 Tax=Caenorhabditis elegans TaxID=6239 RepID=O76363_CAEEL|nr:Uncharacterized protein CELE_F29C4.4 [Caenorhabditis elegans]CCD62178.1 Uncharacterized protein CELE_F29C4.4 [Caenorhabditis elegans]|eukprot:NP_499863.2 Uncharacterized protein CELE_F29C4.4 [Caenorhabditis elegans]
MHLIVYFFIHKLIVLVNKKLFQPLDLFQTFFFCLKALNFTFEKRNKKLTDARLEEVPRGNS